MCNTLIRKKNLLDEKKETVMKRSYIYIETNEWTSKTDREARRIKNRGWWIEVWPFGGGWELRAEIWRGINCFFAGGVTFFLELGQNTIFSPAFSSREPAICSWCSKAQAFWTAPWGSKAQFCDLASKGLKVQFCRLVSGSSKTQLCGLDPGNRKPRFVDWLTGVESPALWTGPRARMPSFVDWFPNSKAQNSHRGRGSAPVTCISG